MTALVLSLFPGADLLGLAFELEGFCVVRGPDALLGGDIRAWSPARGRFDGVIGGPPCQAFSQALRGNTATQGNLVPEFERVVSEAAPAWWLMEEVPQAPIPTGAAWSEVLDAWEYGAAQHRRRRFSCSLSLYPEAHPIESRHPDPWPAVMATEHKYGGSSKDRRRAGRKVGRRMTLAEVNAAMGLPANYETPALTVAAAYKVRGNGVPVPMGRALARAIRAATGAESAVAS